MPDPTRIGMSSGFVPSSNRLKTINSGGIIKQSHINNTIKAVVKNTIKPSPEYKIKQNEEGTTLALNTFKNLVGYGDSPLTAKYGNGKVFVTVGMVNMEVPKINGRYLDELDKNGVPPYLQVTSSGYVCVKVNAENGKPFPSKDPEIVFIAGSLKDGNTDSYCLIPLGRLYKIDNDKFSWASFSRGNLRVSRIKAGGNIAQWFWSNYGY
jgi:hypothetical protein